jgi:hypothetical protein
MPAAITAKPPDELDWSDAQRQKRAVAEYLAGLEAEAQVQESGDSRGGGSDGKPTPKCEHMFSALPSNSDIARCIRHVSKVPLTEVGHPHE